MLRCRRATKHFFCKATASEVYYKNLFEANFTTSQRYSKTSFQKCSLSYTGFIDQIDQQKTKQWLNIKLVERQGDQVQQLC
jgi:hypothetical protein